MVAGPVVQTLAVLIREIMEEWGLMSNSWVPAHIPTQLEF
jgi:hypothetical protein